MGSWHTTKVYTSEWDLCPVCGFSSFLCHRCVFVVLLLCLLVSFIMELLPLFGVSCELLMEEFVKKLRFKSSDKFGDLRKSLFLDAVSRNLADPGDVLVSRQKVGVGKTV